MAKQIAKKTSDEIVTNQQVDWDRSQFDDAVTHHGYLCFIDRALSCPCCGGDIKNALPDCLNCGGSGWVYIDRQESRVLCSSISNRNKYEVWTAENMGTVNITCKPQDKLGYMDKVTLLELESWFNQAVRLYSGDDDVFALLTYEPVSVFDVYLFVGSKTKLRRLSESEYTIENNKITVNNNVFTPQELQNIENKTISVRYTHNPIYYIIDINRDLIKQKTMKNCKDVGTPNLTNYVLSAIGRRAHYVLDAVNYDGTNLFDNTDYTKTINYDK